MFFILGLFLITSAITPVPLPERVIVGYADQCNEKVLESVKQGVNVVIWFSISLLKNPTTGAPLIQGEPNMNTKSDFDCVADTILQIRNLNLECVHMISIGGWAAPHPDTSNTAEAVYKALNTWNRFVVARPEKAFYGFDGFDWDIEGTNLITSPNNYFTVACISLMGELSQLAKKDGYLVSLVPPESYLDPSTPLFDLNLTHTYPEWQTLAPGFDYHGHSVYAIFLAKYGKTILHTNTEVDTFDFVTVQLYESYSHADYNITVLNISASVYLQNAVYALTNGWFVDFSSQVDVGVVSQIVKVELNKLVIGVANGWAAGLKVILIYPDVLGVADSWLSGKGLQPRGYAYWNIQSEGETSTDNPNQPVWMAQGLNQFMHIRN